jgi:hypothetical protein
MSIPLWRPNIVVTLPDVGATKATRDGGAATVNVAVLVPVPPSVVTALFPEAAPAGTAMLSWVADRTVQPEVTVAVPNFTAVAPARSCPVTVTIVPTNPDVGLNDVTVGATALVSTEKVVLVAVPLGVTTAMGPLVAPEGTDVTTVPSERAVKRPAVPLNVADVAPARFVPVMVTAVPGPPVVGIIEVTVGGLSIM